MYKILHLLTGKYIHCNDTFTINSNGLTNLMVSDPYPSISFKSTFTKEEAERILNLLDFWADENRGIWIHVDDDNISDDRVTNIHEFEIIEVKDV